MNNKDLERLETLRKLNANKNWENKDLYRLLYKKTFYVTAYQVIKSNPGNMTPGTDGITLDGFSIKTIDKIIEKLRKESFTFDRARRVNIPKSNGDTRPLSVANPRDKIVQQVIKMILEAIYDSPYGKTFSEYSHGFRPEKGTHTALENIRYHWRGLSWIIEGDLTKCFDTINHEILINILRKRIKDERFINLIRKALKAGYLEFNIPTNTIVGTPQGSIISPILANIYLHEFDQFISDQILTENKGPRRPNRQYQIISKRIDNCRERLIRNSFPKKRAQIVEKLRLYQKLRRKFPSKMINDPNYIRIKYIRYADDFMIGFNSDYKFASQIKDQINEFFQNHLKLELNMNKTNICRMKTDKAFFLGTEIRNGGTKEKKVNQGGRRIGNYSALNAPVDKLIKRLHQRGFCTAIGKPIAKGGWSTLEDSKIINGFNSVLNGYLNYYSFVDNFSKLGRIQFILHFSCAKTLALKHKTYKKVLFKKYGKNLVVKKSKGLMLRSDWKKTPFNFKTSKETEPNRILFTQHNFMTRSKLAEDCCICGSTFDVEMHHIKHVKKINQRLKGFERVMAKLNRKQIPVCNACHNKIHQGLYDGISLKEFVFPELAAR